MGCPNYPNPCFCTGACMYDDNVTWPYPDDTYPYPYRDSPPTVPYPYPGAPTDWKITWDFDEEERYLLYDKDTETYFSSYPEEGENPNSGIAFGHWCLEPDEAYLFDSLTELANVVAKDSHCSPGEDPTEYVVYRAHEQEKLEIVAGDEA